MLYPSTMKCTYSYYDPELREKYHAEEVFNMDDVAEFEDMSELIYRAELLKVLDVTKCDEIDCSLKQLQTMFQDIKTNDHFLQCIEKMKETHGCADVEEAFILLFSYDYFFLTHKCLCDFVERQDVNQEYTTILFYAIQ